MPQEPQEVSVFMPTEQAVTVVMPTEQSVTACMPTEQEVVVSMPAEQSVDVVIPVEQSVNVIAQYSETPEPEGDIVFSDFSLGKQPIFQTVILYWTTDPATKDRSRWRIRGSADAWNYTTLGISFVTNHIDNTSMPCTPGAQYEFHAYGITEDDYEEWDILRYIKISAGGVPEFVA